MNDNHRWRYKVEEVKPRFFGTPSVSDLHSRLESLGSQGWELVSVNQPNRYVSTYLYLKKPV